MTTITNLLAEIRQGERRGGPFTDVVIEAGELRLEVSPQGNRKQGVKCKVGHDWATKLFKGFGEWVIARFWPLDQWTTGRSGFQVCLSMFYFVQAYDTVLARGSAGSAGWSWWLREWEVGVT